MKIVTLSDTHGKHYEINSQLPSGDIIIHAGDSTPRGDSSDIEEFCRWYGDLDYDVKIMIAGNHDWGFQSNSDQMSYLAESYGLIYLNDSGYNYKGINIWGSPVQPEFGNWAFNRKRGDDIKKHWNLIPDNTDILVTHGPAYGRLDKTTGFAYQNVGCEDLEETIQRIRPVLHVCGHIHEGRGIEVDHKIGQPPITYVNASHLDDMYAPWEDGVFVFEWDRLIHGDLNNYYAIEE
jgi:predicted phosphodiesterase